MARIGFIVGSGALPWPVGWAPLGSAETRFGEASATPEQCVVSGHQVVAIARHGRPHRYAPHAVNYRANLAALAQAGVEAIIALNTVGGISAPASTGALVVPDQIIDYTWGRSLSIHPPDAVRHIDFSEPYDPALRRRLVTAASTLGEGVLGEGVLGEGVLGEGVVDGATMGVTQGPRLETPAEIARMARDGCDVVGMTGMPEAVLAREMGLPFASLCLVVNPAAGIAGAAIDMAAVAAAGERGMTRVSRLLIGFLEAL